MWGHTALKPSLGPPQHHSIALTFFEFSLDLDLFLDLDFQPTSIISAVTSLVIPTFKNAWDNVALRDMRELRTYAGTIATVFPTTAQVEGDFSTHKQILKGRESLLPFATQCEIHCKQFATISKYYL